MAGYAATARITHVAPHRVSHEAPVEHRYAENATVAFEAPAVEEVSGQPYVATLSDIWDDVREIWRQSMDVLRDPRIY
jgi:hypothetical protein